MNVQKIAIGCDHGGFAYKDAIIQFLKDPDFSCWSFQVNPKQQIITRRYDKAL